MEKIRVRRRGGLFNFSLFKQSFKSNFVSFAITTLGNALIALIMFVILSKLTINTSAASMRNMFDNAKLEHTLKEGSIGSYLAFDYSIEGYEIYFPEVSDGLTSMYDLAYESASITENEQFITLSNALKTSYQVAEVFIRDEDPELRHSKVKNTVKDLTTTLSGFASLDERTKAIVPYYVDEFLDDYYEDREAETSVLIEKSFPFAIKNYIKENVNLGEGLDEKIYEIIDTCIKEGKYQAHLEEFCREQILTVVDDLIPTEFASLLPRASEYCQKLLDYYITDKEAYQNNARVPGSFSVKEQIYYDALIDIIDTNLTDKLYYSYLPNFEVTYLTNEIGQPYWIKYEEQIDGTIKEVQVPITTMADMDKLIPIKHNMGATSNTLQKRYKEILTGVPYSLDEIKAAKDEAATYVTKLEDLLKDNLLEHLDDRTIMFDFDEKKVKEDVIIDKVISMIKKEAEVMILEKYDLKDLSEMNVDEYGMTGEDLMNKISSYVAGAVGSFKTKFREFQRENYSLEDSLLGAMTTASEGVVDMLPVAMNNKLSDLSTRNLYGLIIGQLYFSIAGILLPMVFAVMASNSLVAQQVETGSLAFTLSTPIKRRTIVFTQAAYLVFSLILNYLILFGASVGSRALAIALGGNDLLVSAPISQIALFAFGAFSVMLAITGINFLTSCWFNKTKYAVGIGGGLTVYFLITSILGFFGSRTMPLALRLSSMNFFNNVTIISLFDVQAAIEGDYALYFIKLLPLFAIALACFIVGCIRFSKKDLPL